MPPPKSKLQPRLFFIKNSFEDVLEYFNKDQLEYFFRCKEKDKELLKYKNSIKFKNEEAKQHMYLTKVEPFNAAKRERKDDRMAIPNCVDLVN